MRRLYTGGYDGAVYCLDAGTGDQIWRAEICDWVGSSRVISRRHRLPVIGLEYALAAQPLSDLSRRHSLYTSHNCSHPATHPLPDQSSPPPV
ncbi:MAG: PQQ-binding-like beta-propeller repeat protein [Alphaproteobacteria bacterium]|nr:PQQ-binding-like beta-propeller repeat protein [Alphaproteobacteria bacterium]